jgi:hypothetical protein
MVVQAMLRPPFDYILSYDPLLQLTIYPDPLLPFTLFYLISNHSLLRKHIQKHLQQSPHRPQRPRSEHCEAQQHATLALSVFEASFRRFFSKEHAPAEELQVPWL